MDLKIMTDLWSLLDLVHDRWFNLEEVRFDHERGEVTFLLGEKRKGPYRDKLLKFQGVTEMCISDDAQIGVYDLHDIQPDFSSSSIRITSGFPLEIMITLKEQCAIHILQYSGMKTDEDIG